jgi:uncharacterized protein (TIGR02594 family)
LLAIAGLSFSHHAAHASGQAAQTAYAAKPVRAVSSLVAEAERHLGEGNFTGRPGAWCAWFVSAILRATGRPELPNGMAASALAYGPRTRAPQPGDLAVVATRRGRFGHVGIVVADLGWAVEIVSGNWSGRVARARISRRSVTAFVKV